MCKPKNRELFSEHPVVCDNIGKWNYHFVSCNLKGIFLMQVRTHRSYNGVREELTHGDASAFK